jgi:hypothetical protein
MERSCGFMKTTEKTNLSPEETSDKYIELEKLHRELGEKIKNTPDYRKQTALRKKKKRIRAEQNLLYPYMVGTGYVTYTEQVLGLKGNQALYGRYIRGTGKK